MTNQYAPPKSNVGDVERGGGSITGEMVAALRGTKPWVLLIGILLLIGSAFMALAGFGMMVGGAMFGAAADGGAQTGALAVAGLVYLAMSLIYVFLGIYLVKYSSAIGRLVGSGASEDMESALHAQRRFWKLSGILTLVGMVIAIIGIVAAIAIPALMMGSR